MPLRPLMVCLIATLATPALADEPARMARMTIDGEAYNVPLGKPFAVRVKGERVTITVEPDEHRLFAQGAIELLYPQGFRPSEASDSPSIEVWTFEGQSAAIMLQRYDDGLDPKSLLGVLVTNIVEQHDKSGAGKPTQQGVKLRGIERSYEGRQVRASVADDASGKPAEIVQNVFTFANSGGVYALMIQDTRAAGGKDSAEYTTALRLLGESLKTGPAPADPATAKSPAPAGPQRRR
ncbi:MAG: hypothetical protein ACRCT8_00405 [Lacipirellulaceae bacterium]